jgi:hypothetical protein
MRVADPDSLLRCSFCRKGQQDVRKLISSPSDHPRVYICDECIEVCHSILEDDRHQPDAAPEIEPDGTRHPWQDHPLLPNFLHASERWMIQESLGANAVDEIASMRKIAAGMMREMTRQ